MTATFRRRGPARRHRAWCRGAVALGALLPALPAGADTGAPAAAPQRIEIIGTTPLEGAGLPRDRVPANVQVLQAADRAGAPVLADALARGAAGVSLADGAGNPWQPDLNFRGFTASPALGTPQGLSVYVDGVRVNEVFGDTVNWDLIPSAAIARVTVMPGSNPVFGRNTLGGAISVATRTGFDSPGASARLETGSFGRRALEFTVGGHDADWGGFLAANALRDRGWGEHNPSRVQQLHASVGYRGAGTEADLSLTLADNRLEGNQALPLSFTGDARQAYTWPDVQGNRLAFVVLKLGRRLSETLQLHGNAYWRRVHTQSANSNVDNGYDPALPPGPDNAATENALSSSVQSRPGFTLQLDATAPLFGRENHALAGLAVDGGRTTFSQAGQPAGSTRDTNSDAAAVTTTSLRSTASALGLYASDTLSLDPRTHLTLSLRQERAKVRLEDQLGGALDGDHAFARLNPAIGITRAATPALTVYAAYNEGMRAPTPVELGCADPAAPCSLPNAFASDPPLRPVVSRTFEIGARGRIGADLGYSLALFRSALADDIQFVSSGGGATSAGYFQNIGQTRRQGLEAALEGGGGRWTWQARYSFLDARFETPLILNSPNNSTAAPLDCAACSDIAVRPGDRLPGLPRHLFKLRLDFAVSDAASLGASLLAQSGFHARGDENNRDRNGPLPGYAVVHLDARWQLARGWAVQARVDNVLDRRYASFGTLGQNVFTGPGNTFDASGAGWRSEQFRTVGAPRGVWVALNRRFGDAPE